MSYKDKIDRIDAICLFPRDFKGSRRFLEEVFGFEPKRIQPTIENPNFIEYYFKGSTFGLWERSAVAEIMGEENLGENAHSFLIAIRLPTCEDINEIHKEFVERGVICVCEPKTYDFGQRAAFYQDHEENIWEFYAICE